VNYLKTKAGIFIILVLLIVLIVIIVQKDKTNDYTTVEEAMIKSNIIYDEIYYIAENKGYSIIFYGEDDILSVGLVTKKRSKYQWIYGVGSKQFNETEQILTRAFTNLPTTKISGNEDELVSLTFGVINDEGIEELKIQYKDQVERDATIISTSKGPIWFCISDTPVNYDPDVVRFYKNGETKSGWY
jgi:hypothetical protein